MKYGCLEGNLPETWEQFSCAEPLKMSILKVD